MRTRYGVPLPSLTIVEAELAVAALRVGVDLAGGELQALHHDLEVLDGALDARVHFFLGRQNHAWIGDVHRSGIRKTLEALANDARALLQLFDAHHEAVEAVALHAHRNVEFDFPYFM